MAKKVIDVGHENLFNDIGELLLEAESYDFHDFKNKKHAAPKVALVGRLNALRDNVYEGRYDNKAL